MTLTCIFLLHLRNFPECSVGIHRAGQNGQLSSIIPQKPAVFRGEQPGWATGKHWAAKSGIRSKFDFQKQEWLRGSSFSVQGVSTEVPWLWAQVRQQITSPVKEACLPSSLSSPPRQAERAKAGGRGHAPSPHNTPGRHPTGTMIVVLTIQSLFPRRCEVMFAHLLKGKKKKKVVTGRSFICKTIDCTWCQFGSTGKRGEAVCKTPPKLENASL